MPNLYVTPDDVQLQSAKAAALTDAQLLALIEMVSRRIDSACGRFFYTESGIRYFDGNGGCSLALPVDFQSIIAIATDEDDDLVYEIDWEATDFVTYPYNDGPRWKLYVAPDSDLYFPNGMKSVKLTGVWGYGDGTASPWGTSGVTGTVATTGGTSLTLAGNGPIVAGQTIRIGDEQMYVSAVATGATGPATVERGVNGTTATTHSAAAITIARYPRDIQLYALWRTGVALNELASAGISSETISDYSYRNSTAAEMERMELWGLGKYRVFRA